MDVVIQILKDLSTLASTRLLAAVVAAILVVGASKFLLRFLTKTMTKCNMDATLAKFLTAATRGVVYFIAVVIVASALGFEMSSLVALASVVSASFALAASGALSNLFGGIMLLVAKPFGVGDYVAIAGVEGTVMEVSILNTKINTNDNKRITMPNSNIVAATVVNYTSEGKRRVDLVFSVGYENEIERVKTAIRATVENHEKVVDKDQIFVRVSAYNDSTISYTMRAWAKTEDYWDVHFDLMEQVKHTFDQVGITMVFPILTVQMENPKGN